MLKAIIFDADNTLYKVKKDNAYGGMFAFLEKETGVRAEILEKEWKAILGNILSSPDSRSLKMRSRERSIQLLLEKSGISDRERIKKISDAALLQFWKRIVSDLEFGGNEKEILSGIKKKYALAIASDEFRKPLEAKLNRVFGDWRIYFKFLISAEDAGEQKPSLKYWTMALEKLKIKPPEALAVGDSWERDLAPAKKAGIKTVLLSEGGENKNADFTIKSLTELARALKEI